MSMARRGLQLVFAATAAFALSTARHDAAFALSTPRENVCARLAIDTLHEIRVENAAPDRCLAKALRAAKDLSDEERGLAASSVLGCASRLKRYEWILGARGVRGADGADVAARLLLEHADETAAPLRDALAARVGGAAAPRNPVPWPDGGDDALATRSGVPLWLARRLRRDFGDAVAAEVAFNSTLRGPVTLRVAGGFDLETVARRIGAARPPESLGAPRALTLPYGRPRGGVWALPGWDDGAFEVQDAGSQAVAEACGGGGTALDFCAGNGGKTLALAERFESVWCHDVDASRLARLRARAAKAGVARRVFCSDEAPLPAGPFDVVLVDAPCSGSGVLRRFGRTVDFAAGAGDADLDGVLDAHAALRRARDRNAGDADLDDVLDAHAALRRARDRVADARSGEALAELAELQLAILRRAADAAADRLVYATCSVLAEENAAVVRAFEASPAARGFEPWDFDASLEGAAGHARTLLPSARADGFFVARWRRASST